MAAPITTWTKEYKEYVDKHPVLYRTNYEGLIASNYMSPYTAMVQPHQRQNVTIRGNPFQHHQPKTSEYDGIRVYPQEQGELNITIKASDWYGHRPETAKINWKNSISKAPAKPVRDKDFIKKRADELRREMIAEGDESLKQLCEDISDDELVRVMEDPVQDGDEEELENEGSSEEGAEVIYAHWA